VEIARLILDYLRLLIWPSVIVAVFIAERKRLALLLDRLTGWDIPGFGRIDLRPQPPQEEKPQPPPNVPEPGQLEKLRKQAVDIETAYKQLSAQYANLYKGYEYEALWNQLYKSQIELVQFLNVQPGQMILYQGGIPFFQKGMFFHGQKPQGYDHYIGFLAQNGLTQLVSDNSGGTWIKLTPKGVEFLQYMTGRGLQLQMKTGM
jgi:hypothetical protein